MKKAGEKRSRFLCSRWVASVAKNWFRQKWSDTCRNEAFGWRFFSKSTKVICPKTFCPKRRFIRWTPCRGRLCWRWPPPSSACSCPVRPSEGWPCASGPSGAAPGSEASSGPGARATSAVGPTGWLWRPGPCRPRVSAVSYFWVSIFLKKCICYFNGLLHT
jgi:hypothetical protein